MADARIHTPFRINQAGRDWLDQLAQEGGVDRSAVIRAALAVARKHEAEVKARIKEQM